MRTSRNWSGARPLGRAMEFMGRSRNGGRESNVEPAPDLIRGRGYALRRLLTGFFADSRASGTWPRPAPHRQRSRGLQWHTLRLQPATSRQRMIRSMTAFAAGERSTQWGTLGCEMRAVNHRFLELGVRLPDELRLLEPALRERVSARVSRGKVDLTLRLRAGEGGGSLQVNDALLRQLGALAGDLDARFPALRTQFTELLQFPGVLQSTAGDPAALHAQALELLDEVLDDFIAAREREGGKLVAAILERVDGIAAQAAQVRELIPAIRAGQRAKLDARIELGRASCRERVCQYV